MNFPLEKGLRGVLILTFLFFIKGTSAQFIDANILFKPRLSLETEYILPQENNNLNGFSSEASLLIPIKNKFSVGTTVKDLISSGSIKDALKKVQPKMSQVFLRVDGGYTELYSGQNTTQRINHGEIGVTGINLKLKGLKLRALLYSFNLGVYETFDNYSTPSIFANGMIGQVKILNLNSLFFYGAYAQYYDGQFLGSPVLGYLVKITPKLSYTLILPSQTKLTYKVNKNWRQDAIFGLQSQQFGDYDFQNPQRVSLRNNNLYASTQSRIKLGQQFHLYVEGGYNFNRRLLQKDGYETVNSFTPNNGFYLKGTLILNFGKALLNSGVFDLDI